MPSVMNTNCTRFLSKRIVLYSTVGAKFAVMLRYMSMVLAVASCTYQFPTIINIIFVDYPVEGGKEIQQNLCKNFANPHAILYHKIFPFSAKLRQTQTMHGLIILI